MRREGLDEGEGAWVMTRLVALPTSLSSHAPAVFLIVYTLSALLGTGLGVALVHNLLTTN